MITRQDGRVVRSLRAAWTRAPAQVRLVGVASESYHVARKYMIRLSADDLRDPQRSSALARRPNPRGSEKRFGPR
jgi:hypothetical protein